MNKRLLAAGLACALAAAVSGCGGSSDSSSNKFTLALEQGNFDELPDWVALDKGFYKEHGLDVEAKQLKTGTTGIKALIGGQAQLATGGGTAVVQADAAGANVKFIAGLLQTTPYVIAAKPSITSVDDLKGKTFAVSEFGSSSDGAARAALLKDGLEPGKDVQILQLGSNSQRLAGVASGSATATVLSPDQTGELDKSGLHVVENLAELNIATVHLSIATTQKVLDNHPDLAANARAAIGEALTYIKDPANKDDVLKIAAKYMESKPTDSNVIATYSYYLSTTTVQGVYPPDSKMLSTALQNDINTQAKTDKSAASLKPTDVVAEGSLFEN